MRNSRTQRLRAILVWLLTSSGCAALGALAAPPALEGVALLRHGGPADADFVTLLAALCGAAGTVCAGWLWLVTSVVVSSALVGRPGTAVRGCPAVVRRVVLLGCGIVLAGGATAPALAQDNPGYPGHPESRRGVLVLQGLPLPERAESVGRTVAPHRAGTTAPAPAPEASPARARSVVVKPGDSLWSISRGLLGPQATDDQLDASWRAIYALNRSAIGADPDLIHPGQRLSLPADLPTGSHHTIR